MKNKKLLVQDTNITIKQFDKVDFISLTDIARAKNQDEPKVVEFDSFRKNAGLNSFTLSPSKWIEATNAIKEYIIPKIVDKKSKNLTYSNEADVLNIALFGTTAKQWRDENSDKDGNVRDYASVEQLIVLSNLESLNSLLIKQNILQYDRLLQLNEIAISQIKSLVNNTSLKKLIDAK